jgi:predicted RNA-binding Zn ribbon-like protein
MSETKIAPADPARAEADGHVFEISGGHPALDFANTISRRERPEDAREDLTDYGRLVTWGRQARLVTEREAEALRSDAAAHPRAALAAWRRAVAAREAIFSIFASIAAGGKPPAEALETLNAALPAALGALRVGSERGGYVWRFVPGDDDLAPMLAPVVRAAAELLTSDDAARVRECGADTCRWLFLDGSKNGTRRWCDMKICGNRAKARRHYEREKKAARRARGS